MKDKRQQLWGLLLKIPQGKIITYKILAKKLNIHPRTAGIFLGQNKFPRKYPCYKVIKSNGLIGGYSGAGGVKQKIKLLRKDGIEIKNKKVINLKKFLYKF